MPRFIISILLILGAGSLFYFVTNPIINDPRSVDAEKNVTGGIKALYAEKKSLDQSIEEIAQLAGQANNLQAKVDKLDKDQIDRLNVFLPDHVNDLQLVLDIDTIAQKSGMQIKGIKVNTDLNKDPRAGRAQVEEEVSSIASIPQVAKVGLSFETSGTYSQLRSFLGDLSRSLRVLNVTKISLSTAAPTAKEEGVFSTSVYNYKIDLETYWLK